MHLMALNKSISLTSILSQFPGCQIACGFYLDGPPNKRGVPGPPSDTPPVPLPAYLPAPRVSGRSQVTWAAPDWSGSGAPTPGDDVIYVLLKDSGNGWREILQVRMLQFFSVIYWYCYCEWWLLTSFSSKVTLFFRFFLFFFSHLILYLHIILKIFLHLCRLKGFTNLGTLVSV